MLPSELATVVVATEPAAGTSGKPPKTAISRQELIEILARHCKWLESNKTEGEQADLPRAPLAGFDLTGANLRGANFYRANFKGADLFLADFEGACLAKACLQDANLLGSHFSKANLQGANLEGATGLLAGQLAGSDLFGAVLPPHVAGAEGLKQVRQLFKYSIGILIGVVAACALAWWRIVTTTDLQLLKRSSALPFDRFGQAVPMAEFYLVAPLVLLGLYIFAHCYLQHVWEALASLPAVFPDGQRLEKIGPWLVIGLARRQIEWLGRNGSPLALLGAELASLFAYWVAPVTLLLFWVRYLTRQDLHGSMLQVLLVVCAVAFATLMPRLFPRRPSLDHPQPQPWKKLFATRELYVRGAVVIGVGILLSLLSLGTILGVPHDGGRDSIAGGMGIQTWAAGAFWLVGYNPYADLAESDISSKPAGWTGRDEDLPLVKGAQLNKQSLRHAEAYRSSWINARLWKADFRNANLSEADMQGANLRQAILRSAVLDRARLNRANLEEADLTRANFARASLKDANLSFARLGEAVLIDARLDGASLYGAELRASRLTRASLERADLREVNLENGMLSYAVLREAYLSLARLQGADLRKSQAERALLMEADLRRADLRDAVLQEAKLQGADLTGANLDGADLRGALGLTASQICSVASRRELKLDESLQLQVDTLCGSTLR